MTAEVAKSSNRGSKPGERRGGRQKGTPNKLTALAKDVIAQAFDKMGGVEALVTWAETDADTKRVFYSQIWTKIVPLAVGSDPDNPLPEGFAVLLVKGDDA